MRLNELNKEEYKKRTAILQKKLKENNIDAMIAYGSECESSTVRYFTGFWPFFDFVSLVIPKEGEPVLLTGGPESSDFAKEFSKVGNIKIHSLLVETSSPEWIRKENEYNFANIFNKIIKVKPKKIGITNWNIFPHVLFEDLRSACPDTEFIIIDDIVLSIKSIKSKEEIPYIVKAYEITEDAMKKAINNIKPGMKEWEVEAIASSSIFQMGAERLPFPVWVCSGYNTRLSLSRSTNKVIDRNELIQLTFGTQFMGYCGTMCRPLSFGKPRENAENLMNIGLEAINYALDNIKPGKLSSDIFQGYYNILTKYNLEKFSLYGPAHGTGSSEVEGLWLSKSSNFIIEPNMLFNIDIWISDGEYGLRYEDGILITENGLKELTKFRREVIIL